jgi:hypothetical protein
MATAAGICGSHPSGEYPAPVVRYAVDTNRDGKPDWQFTGPWPDKEIYERIRARRGF